MSRKGVRLYAEFLLNISQVTIFANLDLTGNDEETAHFSSDKKRIKITYADSEAAITYPNGISGTAIVHLPIKAAAQLSLRLEITEKGDPYWKNSLETLNDSLWAAHSFTSQTTIACRQCKTIICDAGQVSDWRDLPRGDWAEAMDFWHCHKPTESKHAQPHQGKNYESVDAFMARPGIALIDSSDIILAEPDVKSLNANDIGDESEVHCTHCKEIVGAKSPNLGYKLHKWNLSIRRGTLTDWEANDVQCLVCVQMLELADSQGSKKFLLGNAAESQPSKRLLLWILNPDLKYCASYVGDGYPRRAMKVLYKDSDIPSSDTNHNQYDSSLQLPDAILTKVCNALTTSNEMLPSAARTLQGWNAGLLDRFNPVDYAASSDEQHAT